MKTTDQTLTTALDRRDLLKRLGAGALSAVLPAGLIERALAIPAHRRSGTIEDVEHIVVLMQENRSFDHYFGSLRGVRGFADPRAVTLPSGQPVWAQPDGKGGVVLPFRPPVASVGETFLPDPPHGWNDTHAAWNQGRHDGFVPHKGIVAMTYHTRADAPFHYALADAFTVCDAYHCSLMGPTDPNRYHLWSGWVGNDGAGGGPVITNAEAGYDWSTYPERLERAGISWKVYQDQGVGLDGPGFWGWTEDAFIGNYGDNALLYFHQYQNAKPGEALAERAKTGTGIAALARDPLRLFDQLRADVDAGRLPQVSWLVAPEAYSEHPNWPAAYGAWYVSQVLEILTAHPEVFARTALFINFDEEGGFFDHMVPPTPPATPAQGASTASIANEIYPGDASHVSAPYGLGMRVPMLVVSPWSKGGYVNSQLFDHTSVIRFIEARFAGQRAGLVESNITAWRRAVVGDLTSAFDFATPNDATRLRLPSTRAWQPTDLERQPDATLAVPGTQRLPEQEAGVRPARALPYAPQVQGRFDAAQRTWSLDFGNTGAQTIVYQVRAGGGEPAPRSYTVEPRLLLSDRWSVAGPGYDLAVHGPNGFLRRFKGKVDGANLETRVSLDEGRLGLTLVLGNRGARAVRVRVRDHYSGREQAFDLEPGASTAKAWLAAAAWGWYDLSVSVDRDLAFEHRLAGHIENGKDSISDPAMGRVRIAREQTTG